MLAQSNLCLGSLARKLPNKRLLVDSYFIVVSLLLCVAPVLASSGGCNIYVSQEGLDSADCGSAAHPCASIQQGVDRANETNTVCVLPGPMPYRCPAEGQGVVVDKPLTLVSWNGRAVIDCGGKGRAFLFKAGATSMTLEGLEMRNGNVSQDNGGGIFSSSTRLTLRNCSFLHNFALHRGGAVWADQVTALEIRASNFHDNAATGGGALLVYFENPGAVLRFYANNFTSNRATNDGGAAWLQTTAGNTTGMIATFENNTFSGNVAGASGGGLLFAPLTRGKPQVVSGNTYHLVGNLFKGNQAIVGGGLAFTYGVDSIDDGWSARVLHNEAVFEENTFLDNVAQVHGGGVLFVYPWFFARFGGKAANNTVSFVRGLFRNNSVVRVGGGGGAYVTFPIDPPIYDTTPNYRWTPSFRNWAYSDNLFSFHGVTFKGNTASCSSCMGGALEINSGQAIVRDCRFEDNRASFFGGAIQLDDSSTTLNVTNSFFSGNQAGWSGGDLYSFAGGNLSLSNVAFAHPMSGVAFYDVPQGGLVEMGCYNSSCPSGHTIFNRTVPPYPTDIDQWGNILVTTTSLSCQRCHEGTYYLTGAIVSRGTLNDIICQPCPGEADCSRGGADVYSLPGYWCSRNPRNFSLLACTACPSGYCLNDSPSPWNSSCVTNRQGKLCGTCTEHHSEAMGTSECLEDSDCTAGWWVLLVALGIGLAFVILLVWLPLGGRAAWKSTLFYLQVLPLLLSGTQNADLRNVLAVFSLDPAVVGLHVKACPWAGFTVVEKIASGYAIPVISVTGLFVMLAAHRLLRCLLGRRMDQEEAEGEEGSSEYSRYASGLVAVLLLAYQGTTSTTMTLLACVDVAGTTRLFWAGEIECWTLWQYPLFILLGLLAFVPLLPVAVRRIIRTQRACAKKENPYGRAVLTVLEGPYTRNRRWWESVFIFRRLSLLVIMTFILHPVWKAVAAFILCLFYLQTHMHFDPYNDRRYGWAETCFLLALTMLAALAVPRAVYTYLGRAFDGETAKALGYLELGIAIIPLAFCVLVVLEVHGRSLFRMKPAWDRCIGCWHSRRDMSAYALVPSVEIEPAEVDDDGVALPE